MAIDDWEIWACAQHLICQHGDDAWFVAARRADELFEAGDLAGSSTWQRIVERIARLENRTPDASIH